IQTHVDCGNAPAEVRIQETQFNQMLVNLLKNAMEAIDELKESGGLEELPRIEIRAYVRQDFLVLEVQDNGIGIEQKNLKAIFGAGYTTKREGSGLGLHSAANFVTSSGGRIQPLSDGYGTGATMCVMLRLDTTDHRSEDPA
ncbi:MAG: ATP-binding protein, partial [Gemmatimonadota bacterium]|nr:ATP-binding protein [Gemmatimonadota bacterium]